MIHDRIPPHITSSPRQTRHRPRNTAARYLAAAVCTSFLMSLCLQSTAAAKTSTRTYGGNKSATLITVGGSTLTNISSSGEQLTPTFSSTDTDYVWHCNATIDNITLHLTSAGTISVGTAHGAKLTIELTVHPNQAVIVVAPDKVQYWIRCLPVTFPHLTVLDTGKAEPGYYVTGSFSTPKVRGYPMILNSHGTPVWYVSSMPGSAQDVELLPGTHTVAWAESTAYHIYNLDTQQMRTMVPPEKAFDGHELFRDQTGDYWMISRPIVSGVTLAAIGYPTVHSIDDCIIQQISPNGKMLWKWNAINYVSPDEANKLAGVKVVNGTKVADVYHCNSIDVNPTNPNRVLVSMRQAGVFLINKKTKQIIWKLGGTAVAPLDHEPVIRVVGTSEGGFIGQHDARFQPNGKISMFDDHTRTTGAARGIVYSINSANNTASPVWQYVAPSGENVDAMGSFRRYDSSTLTFDEAGVGYAGPVETVVDWGAGIPRAGFTVISDKGNLLLRVEFPAGIKGNRGTKAPETSLTLSELRNSAGLPFP